jgi:hypothetical protein
MFLELQPKIKKLLALPCTAPLPCLWDRQTNRHCSFNILDCYYWF